MLNVLGMYPGDPGPPGSDCAGIVMHAGVDAGFKSGQYMGSAQHLVMEFDLWQAL